MINQMIVDRAMVEKNKLISNTNTCTHNDTLFKYIVNNGNKNSSILTDLKT